MLRRQPLLYTVRTASVEIQCDDLPFLLGPPAPSSELRASQSFSSPPPPATCHAGRALTSGRMHNSPGRRAALPGSCLTPPSLATAHPGRITASQRRPTQGSSPPIKYLAALHPPPLLTHLLRSPKTSRRLFKRFKYLAFAQVLFLPSGNLSTKTQSVRFRMRRRGSVACRQASRRSAAHVHQSRTASNRSVME